MCDVEDQDVEDGKPGTVEGEGITVFVGDIPCLTEACESDKCDDIGCNVFGHEGVQVFHEGRSDSVCDGPIHDFFGPSGERSLLGGGEEEFKPSFGREVLERDCVKGAGGFH